MTASSDQSQSGVPAHRGRRTFAIALALTVLLLGIGLLALLVITPARPVGNASAVSAAFLGYTNNAVGKRIAVFSINNRSPIAVRRQWYYEVQVFSGTTWAPQPTVHLPYGLGPIIPPNQSEIWTINAPAAGGKWRVWFPYVEDHGRLRQMKKTIRGKLRGLGLAFKDSEPTYMGLTAEVDPPGRE
jgi:hypothetical protein